jgi:hypothetical protein
MEKGGRGKEKERKKDTTLVGVNSHFFIVRNGHDFFCGE